MAKTMNIVYDLALTFYSFIIRFPMISWAFLHKNILTPICMKNRIDDALSDMTNWY